MRTGPGGSTRRVALALTAALALTGCLSEAIDSPVGPDLEIRVLQSGGITGRTFGFVIEGGTGTVKATQCSGVCPVATGETIVTLSTYQLEALVDALEAAGIFALDGTDFGTPCCDQIGMRIEYRNRGRLATVEGTPGRFPPRLLDAAVRLAGLGSGLVPAVVAFASSPAGWPADPLTLDEIRVDGSFLELVAVYGGGCEEHPIDVVAWNGWLESFPVQVGAIASHDARSDPCDALVRSPRRFDLTPLRRAYEASYGPGPATIVINLADANRTHRIEYRF